MRTSSEGTAGQNPDALSQEAVKTPCDWLVVGVGSFATAGASTREYARVFPGMREMCEYVRVCASMCECV